MNGNEYMPALLIVTTALFAGFGIWHARRRKLTVEDFISSRNSAGARLTTASIVASVAGAWILFSPAETAVRVGLAGVIGYALGQAAPSFVYAVLGPRMRQIMPDGHSLTEYARHRFGRPVHLFTLCIMLFYMFIYLAAELTAIAAAFHLVAAIPPGWTALVVAAATVAYTMAGGLRSSLFTDGIQFLLIVPLLAFTLLITVAKLDGLPAALAAAREAAPHALALAHRPGIEFGVMLIIAIVAAELFNQGYWQRVYACRDYRTLRRSFLTSGMIIMPLLLLAGLFGLLAVGQGLPEEQASTAFFHLIRSVLPVGAVAVVLVLAVTLVMSSMDTLLNGIVSILISDLAPRRRPAAPGRLLRVSRWLTVLIALPAVAIAARNYSVLYLFLIADLVCAGAVFPLFFGMYADRLSGRTCLLSALLGIAVGALFFPKPDFTPWLALPLGGNLLASFGLALGVSVACSLAGLAFAMFAPTHRAYDYQRLREQVRLIEG
jgi:Na+/proline symporter